MRPFSRRAQNGRSLVERLFQASFAGDDEEFPIRLEQLDKISTTKRLYREFAVGESLDDLGDGIKVETRALIHPGGCCGYRVTIPEKKPIVIATDNDIGADPDPSFIKFIDRASIIYLDNQYTDGEYEGDIATPAGVQMPRGKTSTDSGWGHSRAQDILDALQRCDVLDDVKIVFGHHEPSRMDQELIEMRDEIWKRGEKKGLNPFNEWHFGKDGCMFFWI